MIGIYISSFGKPLSTRRFNELLNHLPAKLSDRILRFRRWQDRHASLYGKLLLKRALADFDINLGLEDLQYTEFHRPFLSSEIDFNISHSGEMVVCALSRHSKIGIDIEKIKFIDIASLQSFWTTDESCQILEAQDPHRKFFTFWTRKEALIKVNGKGLHLPLNEIDVRDDKIRLENSTWQLQHLPLHRNYKCHIAYDAQLTLPITQTKVDFSKE